ncbi:MAG: Phosphate regulon transcriptional regulatory protein PhoB (SphR) [Acidobacteria bacterium]|nr:Phosphate regulon transcriptional regulatory protein PhoB (SphR) [Acidobacteriota bacterium]
MTPQDPNDVPAPLDPDKPEVAMRDARQRFLAAFPKRSDSIGLLLATVATIGSRGPVGPLRQMVHRMSGLAGMLGFPGVSARARDLELLLDGLDDGTFDADRASRAFEAVEQAFTEDLTHPPEWAGLDPSAGGNRRVLVVEDDDDQREVICINLRASGFVPIPVQSGDLALSVARAEPPDLIILDAILPGLDGYTVCRLLKSDPMLASTPILFLTVRASLDDRLVGLALGADEYLVKPVDMPELVVRIQLLLARLARPGRQASPAGAEGPARHG